MDRSTKGSRQYGREISRKASYAILHELVVFLPTRRHPAKDMDRIARRYGAGTLTKFNADDHQGYIIQGRHSFTDWQLFYG